MLVMTMTKLRSIRAQRKKVLNRKLTITSCYNKIIVILYETNIVEKYRFKNVYILLMNVILFYRYKFRIIILIILLILGCNIFVVRNPSHELNEDEVASDTDDIESDEDDASDRNTENEEPVNISGT